MIQKFLFCIGNLCDDEIRARLVEEREYEGQRLGNLYHWWLFPNWDEVIFSKPFLPTALLPLVYLIAEAHQNRIQRSDMLIYNTYAIRLLKR